MESPIGPSTSMVQAGSFGSAKCLPARSRLCCDSSARSRWRRFHFYWARSLAATVGLRWEKCPVGTRNRFLPHSDDFVAAGADRGGHGAWQLLVLPHLSILSYKHLSA